jgi:hypothetical protein
LDVQPCESFTSGCSFQQRYGRLLSRTCWRGFPLRPELECHGV